MQKGDEAEVIHAARIKALFGFWFNQVYLST